MGFNTNIPSSEIDFRISKIQSLLVATGIDAIVLNNNANLFYTAGYIFNGYVYIPKTGNAIYFVRRPVGLSANNIIYINKPEQIVEHIDISKLSTIGLELDTTSYSTIERLNKIFPNATITNASGILRKVRSTKTPFEIECLIQSGEKHAKTYSQISSVYRDGMTDLEFQIEIERLSRLEGCLGQFRISGDSMEIFMGNLIAGENADNPSPYDFAMGGAGLNPSLPVGCNGTTIAQNTSIMVDLNGNFTGYMTDMTRVFSVGEIGELAKKAHKCSQHINHELAAMGKPGTPAKALFERALAIATEEELDMYFMGHRQHAGFVGHGVGIEVNELPVIAPRSKDILEENNIIALEPKFVIPQVGAVGIENTYVVTPEGMKSITNAPEEIISLD